MCYNGKFVIIRVKVSVGRVLQWKICNRVKVSVGRVLQWKIGNNQGESFCGPCVTMENL